MDRLGRFLNTFIFLKNGYSLLAHVLPVGVASLLLLILSVPDDNLLVKLVQSLAKPPIFLPAALLSIVTATVYVLSIYVQVRGAYLFPQGNIIRTVTTSVFFLLLCTLMAYGVLRSASPPKAFTLAGIWASSLVASLSLTGIGWSTPTKWVEALGITNPDYKEAQRLARLLTEAFRSVRTKSRGSKDDVTAMLSYAGNLRAEVEKNVDREPNWAKANILQARNALARFAGAVSSGVASQEKQFVDDFAQVMNCKKATEYEDVACALKDLTKYWPEWKCSE